MEIRYSVGSCRSVFACLFLSYSYRNFIRFRTTLLHRGHLIVVQQRPRSVVIYIYIFFYTLDVSMLMFNGPIRVNTDDLFVSTAAC